MEPENSINNDTIFPLHSDKEIFHYFIGERTTPGNLHAYGYYSSRKFEWIETLGREPSSEELTVWIENRTKSELDAIKDSCYQNNVSYSFVILKDEIEKQKREAIENYLQNIPYQIETKIKDIQNLIDNRTNFWKQFGLNILGGVLGAVIFTCIALLFYYIVVIDPSAVKAGKSVIENNTHQSSQFDDK